jgi:hypothetical protein
MAIAMYLELDNNKRTRKGSMMVYWCTQRQVRLEGIHHGVHVLVVEVLHHRVDDADIPHLAKHITSKKCSSDQNPFPFPNKKDLIQIENV